MVSTVAVAAVVGLAVSGCSSEPARVGAPQATAASTAAPDDHHGDDDGHDHEHEEHSGEGPPPPPMPYIAAEESLQGASAFTTYFFEVVEHAYANVQSDKLAQLVTQDCAGCARIVADIDEARAKGERYQGGATHVLAAAVRGDVDPEATTVDVTVTVEDRVRTVSATGEVVRRDKAQRDARYVVGIERVEDEWRVSALDPAGAS